MSIRALIATKVTNLELAARNLSAFIEEIIRRSIFGGGTPSVLIELDPSCKEPRKPSFSLKEILENGFLLCPTPKHRTTAEKKLKKKFQFLPNNRITKYSQAKTNIITCLDCGSYHEKGSICGGCYAKVKAETDKIHAEMFKNDDFKYNYPPIEVKFKYENDAWDEAAIDGKKKIVIEIPEKRPDWFDHNLLTKVSTEK